MAQESLYPPEVETGPEATEVETATSAEARRAIRKKLREESAKSVEQMEEYRKETRH